LEASADQTTLSGTSDIGDIDGQIHFTANAGDNFVIMMSGDNTAVQTSATSTAFSTATSFKVIVEQVEGE